MMQLYVNGLEQYKPVAGKPLDARTRFHQSRFRAGVLAVKAIALWIIMLLFVSAASSQAQETVAEVKAPDVVVTEVTGQMLQVVKDKASLLDSDPQAFYDGIQEVLEPVVAFDYIARGVMGGYYKRANSDQRARFSEALQQDLVSTYAKGIVLYGTDDITVEPITEDLGDRRRASVIQNVKTDGGDHVLAYTMGLDSTDNQWKLLNVTIDGVNLGKTFRSQFAQAVQQKNGDLDAVISGWSKKN